LVERRDTPEDAVHDLRDEGVRGVINARTFVQSANGVTRSDQLPNIALVVTRHVDVPQVPELADSLDEWGMNPCTSLQEIGGPTHHAEARQKEPQVQTASLKVARDPAGIRGTRAKIRVAEVERHVPDQLRLRSLSHEVSENPRKIISLVLAIHGCHLIEGASIGLAGHLAAMYAFNDALNGFS
jgi:hypothetical protein